MMDTINLNLKGNGTHYVAPKDKCRIAGLQVTPQSLQASGNVNIKAPNNSSAVITQADYSSTSAGAVVKGAEPSSIANATKYQNFGPDQAIPVVVSSAGASAVHNVQITVDPFQIGPHVFPSSG